MPISNTAAHHTTKTIYGIKNEMHSFIEVPFSPDFEMTLNYKYNSFADMAPSKAPTLKYFGMGIKGCYAIDDENLVQPYIPKETDADLYEPIPFRCVPINEDLSATERAKYRMRVRQTFHGNAYWAYYLKVIEIVDSTVKVTQVDPVTGEEIEYVMNPSNLYPIPTKPDTSGTITGSVSEVNVSVTALLSITGKEVTESIGVLYNGDVRRARISEIGLYTGEDRTVSGLTHDNHSFNYNDSVYTQLICHHTNIGVDLSHPNSSDDKYLRVGSGSILVL